MVRALTFLEILNKNLTEELFAESLEEARCPHLRRDSESAYCSKDQKQGEAITEERRIICDPNSLQFWCLDKDRYCKCLWYGGKDLKSLSLISQ